MIHLKASEDGVEELVLQPMENWRLFSEFKNGKLVGGRIQFVWLFGIIGVFVLFLACINFMNLSTARSEKRAKEVGIRKTVGSLRTQLIKQFLTESVIVAFLSLIVALLLVLVLLPFFNGLSDKDIHVPFPNIYFWIFILVFTIFTGIVSGSYPGFLLVRLQSHQSFKGNIPGRAVCRPSQKSSCRDSIYYFHRPDHWYHHCLPANSICQRPTGGI